MSRASSWRVQFGIIYVGQAFSLLGSAVVQFAVIWWLTEQTKSAVVLTLSTIVAMLPNMLVGPFAGVWVDRYNRRYIMMLADGVVALSSVVLGLAFLLNESPPIWFILVTLFVRGVGNTFHAPAMQSAIPMLVPADMLAKAGGWGNFVTSGATMLGPVLGALLMSKWPIAPIMLVDIAGAFCAVVTLLFIKIPDIPRQSGELHVLSDMKEGLAVMRQNKPLMAVLPPIFLSTVIYMPLGSLFPLLVYTHFAGEAWHNGVVELVFSAGLLLSSLIMGVWGGTKRRFAMVSLAIGLLGLVTAISGALPTSGFWPFVVCCFFMGGSGTFFNVPLMAYIQTSTAPEVMGKVMSLFMAVMMLAMPIGLLAAGPISDAVGIANWFLWSGVAMTLTGVLCWLRTRRFDRALAAAQAQVPTADSPAEETAAGEGGAAE